MRLALYIGLVALLLAPCAQASRSVIYGIGDSGFASHWATMGPEIAELGKIQVGIYVYWDCENPQDPVWQIPDSQSVLLTVDGTYCSARLTTRYERTRYARYVRRLVDLHPNVKEVQVWNEADLANWQASQADYVKTLARVYDLVHGKAKVLGFGFSPNSLNLYDKQLVRPTAYSYALEVAAFYIDSHRKRPIMDGFAYHPYWGWTNETTNLLARMLDKTWRGLPQPSPKHGLKFWWTETGRETGPPGWPTYLGMDGTLEQQAVRVAAVAARARRNPFVAADFNFLLGDAAPWLGWQAWTSGLQFYSGERKPAFYAFRAAIG